MARIRLIAHRPTVRWLQVLHATTAPRFEVRPSAHLAAAAAGFTLDEVDLVAVEQDGDAAAVAVALRSLTPPEGWTVPAVDPDDPPLVPTEVIAAPVPTKPPAVAARERLVAWDGVTVTAALVRDLLVVLGVK